MEEQGDGLEPAVAAEVELGVETPEGRYWLGCDWLVAADGSGDPIRGMPGLESKGRSFRDRFLIADVKMEADFPPSDGSGSTRLSIRTSRCCCIGSRIGVWRIDFQLGWEADPVAERQPDRVIPRVQASARTGDEFRPGVGERLYFRLSADGAVPAREGVVRGRRRRMGFHRSERVARIAACRMRRISRGSCGLVGPGARARKAAR